MALLPATASALMTTGDGGWLWQSPLPQGNNLEAVSVIDAQHAVAVGDSGTILTTSDGGATWTSHDTGIAGAHINDVSFINADDGWVMAIRGSAAPDLLMHTTDGGVTWVARGPHGASNVDFIGATRGWACGGNTVWSTRNGGTSWTAVHLGVNLILTDLTFTDAHHGWVVGDRSAQRGSYEYPIILATTDGGATWTKQYNPRGIDEGQLGSVSFGDATHGWATGGKLGELSGDLVLATSDGGATWTEQATGAAGGVDFVDAAHGWIADGTTIVATTDGGSNWTSQSVGVPVDEVSFSDVSNGYATGPDGDIATTTDGGADWQVRAPADIATPWPLLFDATFADPSRGWVVGQGIILATTDGGASWSSQPAVSALTSVHFADAADGWTVGGGAPPGEELGGGGPRLILHTTDGGAGWQTQFEGANPPSSPAVGFEDVTSVDTNRAWVAGVTRLGHPCVGRTSDGGASWHFVTLAPAGGRANAVSFPDARHGWAAGYADVVDQYGSHPVNAIYRTTDGGLTWRREYVTRLALDDVTFLDAKHGWAVGGTRDLKGICGVLTTSDGGVHWTRQDLSAQWEGMRVAFADLRHGWIACGATVLATVDGGRHWRVQRAGSYVTGLTFLDATHGWAVAQTADWSTGDGGILTTTTGGFASP